MNAAVRAVVRMGIYVGCEVYLIKEVSRMYVTVQLERLLSYGQINLLDVCRRHYL